MKLLLLSAIVAAAAQAQQLGNTPNLYSKEKEAALGAELAKQLERNVPLVDNPDALKYVQQTAARLAMQIPNAPFPYAFKLIGDTGDPSAEPMALPGGYIYVPVALFLTSHDESEFAGMLAHAMAHVAERPWTRLATKNTDVPLMFYGGWGGFGVRPSSHVAVPIAFQQMSRPYEEQADADAVKMASGAGYDPEGLLHYLTRQNTSTARLDALRAAMQAPAPNSNDEFLRLQNQLRNQPRN